MVLAKYFILLYLGSVALASRMPSILRKRSLYIRCAYYGLGEDCPPSTTMENRSIDYVGSKMVLNFVVNIKKEIKSFEKGIINIHRCTDQAQEANCEYFQNWALSKVCFLMAQKNMIWSPIVESFTPKLRCPIQKAAYHANNATLDVNVLQDLFGGSYLEKYFWRVRAEGYDDSELWIVVKFGIYFLRGRG